jgi:hypothetical protein
MREIGMKITLLFGYCMFWQAIAHTGGHDQIPLAADADWTTRHMAGKDRFSLLLDIIC